MTDIAPGIVAVAFPLVCAWLIPAVGMGLLVPSLEASGWCVPNYRGRRVFLGLGIVWAFWALGLALAWVVLGPQGEIAGASAQTGPGVLVLLVLVFGLVDDVFGTHEDKGFRGHVRAMARGRLTTGGLKLLGIGAAALLIASTIATQSEHAAGWSVAEQVLATVAGAVLIAGSANLVNLLDLRPGRALKGYILLVAVGFGSGVAAANWEVPGLTTAASLLGVAIWLVGPVLAVWRYDLSERGMLGDAGANAAGALAGYVLLMSLPVWGIVVAAAIVSALNVASERVSFSQVIERTRFLAWLDGLGRLPEGPANAESPSGPIS